MEQHRNALPCDGRARQLPGSRGAALRARDRRAAFRPPRWRCARWKHRRARTPAPRPSRPSTSQPRGTKASSAAVESIQDLGRLQDKLPSASSSPWCQRSGGSCARRVRCPAMLSTRSCVMREADVGPGRDCAGSNARRSRPRLPATRRATPACSSAARARLPARNRRRDFDERDQSEKAAAQRQRFHGFGFEHASQQLARALMADAVGIESQSAQEKPLLQARSRADGQQALQPVINTRSGTSVSSSSAQGNIQPRSARRAKNIGADHPPGQNPQAILERVCACQQRRAAGARELG